MMVPSRWIIEIAVSLSSASERDEVLEMRRLDAADWQSR